MHPCVDIHAVIYDDHDDEVLLYKVTLHAHFTTLILKARIPDAYAA